MATLLILRKEDFNLEVSLVIKDTERREYKGEKKFWTAFDTLWNSSGFPGVAERAALGFCGLVNMQVAPRVYILV